MANIQIGSLPTYTGDTTGVFLVMNDSGNTQTFKVEKETLISGGGGGGTHFNFPVATNSTYNLALTSQYTEIGLGGFQDSIMAFPFTPGQDITISGLTVDFYRPNNNVNGRIKYLIYDNDDTQLLPKNKLVESPELTPGFFSIVQYNTSFTFNAGQTYWLAIAFNYEMSGVDGEISCRGLFNYGTMTIGAPSINDGYGVSYKVAISKSDFSAIPSVWVPATPQYYAGDYLLQKGYYGATVKSKFPEIRFKTI
jgi:hypothetical protein